MISLPPESCIGRWLIADGLQACRVVRIDWSYRGRAPRVVIETIKRDGRRCVQALYRYEWLARAKRSRFADEEDCATFDAVAEKWGVGR